MKREKERENERMKQAAYPYGEHVIRSQVDQQVEVRHGREERRGMRDVRLERLQALNFSYGLPVLPRERLGNGWIESVCLCVFCCCFGAPSNNESEL